jgi:hypothetical protein
MPRRKKYKSSIKPHVMVWYAGAGLYGIIVDDKDLLTKVRRITRTKPAGTCFIPAYYWRALFGVSFFDELKEHKKKRTSYVAKLFYLSRQAWNKLENYLNENNDKYELIMS